MTSVLAMNPGHDGAIALIADGELVYSLEAEKDSFPRYESVTAPLVLEAASLTGGLPDVIAMGGWRRTVPGLHIDVGGGYWGTLPGMFNRKRIFGADVLTYTSSHERSHLLCGLGLSPFDPHEEAAILVWEGQIGAFYHWREGGREIERHEVLSQPGARFASLYGLADPAFPPHGAFPPAASAGKLMALVGLSDDRAPSSDSRDVVASIMGLRSLYPFPKHRYRQSMLYDCGMPHAELCRAAKLLADELFGTFERTARRLFGYRPNLVITGGCGLNCDWNSAWERSGIFSSVFVPPCPNDSGSAIGTAIDAWWQLEGPAPLAWEVGRGAPFVVDCDPATKGWVPSPLNHGGLATAMLNGAIVAWVQDRCEIGPRALGHRSLLASAVDVESKTKLNDLKQREHYRPIAPVCLEEDLAHWFDDPTPDPHMLRFRRVLEPKTLPAVTHSDGSARVQSVTRATAPALYDLLVALRSLTGVGVACNTSLNHAGTGFINRMTDLLSFADQSDIDIVVVDDRQFLRGAGVASGEPTC